MGPAGLTSDMCIRLGRKGRGRSRRGLERDSIGGRLFGDGLYHFVRFSFDSVRRALLRG